jgi:uncharacterized phage protein (TIGR01671 family)
MVYQDFPKGGLTNAEILKRFDNVMQFTGLKDKNGKEIYEGDIVVWERLPTTESDEGKNHIEKSQVVWDGGWGQWREVWIKKPDVSFALADMVRIGNCEIIGNIYENPELLAEEK